MNPDASANSFPAQFIEYFLCVSAPLWFVFQSPSPWQDVYNIQVVALLCPPQSIAGLAGSIKEKYYSWRLRSQSGGFSGHWHSLLRLDSGVFFSQSARAFCWGGRD